MQTIKIPSNIEALIFDMDGTLANTIPAHIRAWQKVLAPYPMIIFNAALFDEINGMPTSKTVEWLNKKYNLSMDKHAIEKEKIYEFNQIIHHTPIQAVEATANIVKTYYGKMPMSIGSGATTPAIHTTLQTIGLLPYFEILVGSDQVKKHKPDPETWLLCAQLMNIEPSKCLVFEDGILGMQGAQKAGMPYIDIRPYMPNIEF